MNRILAEYVKHTLEFKKPAKTSRDTLKTKDSFYLVLKEEDKPDVLGIGECAYIKGLSREDSEQYENQLRRLCDLINESGTADVDFDFDAFPSMEFGLEMAIMDLEGGGIRTYFDENEFFNGNRDIAINGLIWMDAAPEMIDQIDELLAKDYKVLKLKVGAIDLADEINVLKYIRSKHPAAELEIRLDANGAFTPENVMEALNQLKEFDIHSIEQPIKAGQWEAMAKVVKESPIDIALDEELIPITNPEQKEAMLKAIRPQYIILKPSLLGGFGLCEEWMEIADELLIAYWVTSALESNIGLNAIAQWIADLDLTRPQGLGTGTLFKNNIKSPLVLDHGFLKYDDQRDWDLSLFGL